MKKVLQYKWGILAFMGITAIITMIMVSSYQKKHRMKLLMNNIGKILSESEKVRSENTGIIDQLNDDILDIKSSIDKLNIPPKTEE